MLFFPALVLVVIVSEEPFLFNVALLPVEVVLLVFLWSPTISVVRPLPFAAILLVLAGSSAVSGTVISTLSSGDTERSPSCACFLSLFFLAAFSSSTPLTTDLLPPTPVAEGFLFETDTVDFTLGVIDAGFLVDAGLSAGNGGLFIGVAPGTTMLLFADPVELFLACTPVPAAPGRVGVARPEDPPRDARALLTFETVEFVDVFLDRAPEAVPREELAVRKVSLVVEALTLEVGREDTEEEEIVEPREVATRVLGDVTVLFRIVDACERIEAVDDRIDEAEDVGRG